MKKPLIYIVVLLLCGIGGYFFATKKGDTDPTTVSAPAPVTAKKADEDGMPHVSKSGFIFVQMKPFVLPVLGNNGPQQLITLIVSLQVQNTEDEDKVMDLEPKLDDAFLQSLYGALDQGTVRNGRLVDVFKVKQKLKQACNEVLGSGVVMDVLVQDIAQRQFR